VFYEEMEKEFVEKTKYSFRSEWTECSHTPPLGSQPANKNDLEGKLIFGWIH
jgi:hypothetical protein